MKPLNALTLAVAALAAGVARADTAISWYPSVLSAYNWYSPQVFFDAQAGLYKMYFGGRTTQAQSYDSIYYSVSADSINWSTPQEILNPAVVQAKFRAWTTGDSQAEPFKSMTIDEVNDPFVTKHFNTTNNQYQYTMFFTACINGCGVQSNNRIWSMTSVDGINFDFPQPAKISGEGVNVWAAQPSALVVAGTDGAAFWYVYHENRNPANGADHKAYLTKVTGARTAIAGVSPQAVFTETRGNGAGQVSAVNVVQRGSQWDLIFNQYMPNDITNVYRVSSASKTSWTGASTAVIANNNSPYCATLTPSAVPVSSTQYILFTSLITYNPNPPAGTSKCDFWHNQSISRFVINAQ